MTQERKKELLSKIDNATTEEELAEIRKMIDEESAEADSGANVETPAENTPADNEPNENPEAPAEESKPEAEAKPDPEPEAPIDERSLIKNKDEFEKVELVELQTFSKEERKMNNVVKQYNAETRAWAKKCLGITEFDEEEKRALGDAVTTTTTTFVASTADTQGKNNGGLFIPKEVRMELMEQIDEMSPFFRDIRKLNVKGNVDLPWLYAGDDANWYTELTDTVNEGNEYKNLQLTGWELAKDVVLTWKVEDMTVESFVAFVIDELVHKMGTALVHAVIYGDGSSKPTGAIYGLEAVTDGDTPIDVIVNAYGALEQKFRPGVKVYVSTSVKIAMIGYKDNNGNYPFLQGINGTDLFSIETDPFLENNDIIVGNARRYILNEVTPLRVDWERTVQGRKTRYGAYGIYDGKPQPGAFKKAQYVAPVSA